MRKHVLVGVILLLCAGRLYAQLSDSVNYYVRAASTGVVNKTNDQNSYVLNNALRFSYYKRNFSVNTSNAWIYGKQQHKLANNDFTSVLDFDFLKGDRNLYYWGLLHYEKSYSLRVDDRLQAGGGVGYYVVDRKAFVLLVSDGLLYEYTDLSTGEGSLHEYDTYRNSLRVKIRFAYKDQLTFENINFVQHSLEDRKDYILRSNSTISAKVYKWISVTVAVVYNKLNITQRENLFVNYGITFERYF